MSSGRGSFSTERIAHEDDSRALAVGVCVYADGDGVFHVYEASM